MSPDTSNNINAKNKSINDRLADSMMLFGLGIALFFWLFLAFFHFLESPQASWQTLLFGTQFEIYEKLIVSTLFIVFGSHVQTNIKKRRLAEKNLQESEDKYRTILESIEEGYYEINLDGIFTFLNSSMCKIMTHKKEKLLGTNLLSYIAEKDVIKFTTQLKKIKQNDSPTSTIESEFQIKGGGRKIIELSASLINDSTLKPVGIRGIFRDITEKRMLEKNLLESMENVKEARTGVILGLAKLAEYRDTDTGKHLERIREFSKIITEDMVQLPKYKDYITQDYIDDIYLSSILHDIGKVAISDNVLLKKGKLTTEEFEQIKQHSLLGGQALSAIDKQFRDQSFLTIAKEIAYYHHEKWNGNGYPSQLTGKEIPLSARIVAVADVYDALTSKRCYKEAFSHQKSKDIIIEENGESFDPDVVNAFIANEKKFQKIKEEMQQSKVVATT